MAELAEAIGDRFVPGKVTAEAPPKSNGIGEHDQGDIMSLRNLMKTPTEDITARAIQEAERIQDLRRPEKSREEQYQEALAEQEAQELAAQGKDKKADKPEEKTEKEGKIEKPEAAQPPKKKVKPASKAPAMDERALATLAADTAAATVERLRKTEPAAEKTAKPDSSLSAANQKELEVWQHAEETNPELKGIATRYTESLKKIDTYQKNWEAQNPGKEFDDADAEHNEFMDRVSNFVGGTDEAFDDAKMALTEKRILEKLQGANPSKVAEMEQKLRRLEAAPLIAKATADAREGILKSLDVADLAAADDLVKPIAEDAVNRSHAFTEAALNLMNGYVPKEQVDPNLAAQVQHVATMLMTELGAMAPEDTVNPDGQTYVTPHTYYNGMTPAQRQRHWTIGAADVIAKANELIAEDAKKSVTTRRGELEILAKKMGWTLGKPGETEDEPEKTAQSAPEKKSRKPESPSFDGDTKLTVGKDAKNGAKKNPMEDWIARMTK